ncbi:hypothetical protein JKA74_19635 [Marivirga sp. S37H4]|uniref:Uncharacterized protein n=1 Tax=Marivirga aurantiaca TaxID=2802615 RepID=A0A934X1I3_9BACT|nr:hypothetical protein [Marivirga aurantiaca]MBK6267263.1 hypothetical protein [Marivirga aurantiaca]
MISIAIHIVIVFILILLFQRKLNVIDRAIFSTAVFVKIVCGVLLGWLYWGYYGGTGDTLYFFEQAGKLYHYFQIGKISIAEWLGFQSIHLTMEEFSAQSEPRTFFFVRWMSYLFAVTQGEYFTMAIYLSLFSIFAAWKFVKRLTGILPENKTAIYIAFLFIPSVTFWSSGLMKETFMMTLLYFMAYFIIRWHQEKSKWLLFIPILICYWGLWLLKYYVAIVLMPVLILTLLFSVQPGFLKDIRFQWKVIIYFSLMLLGGLVLAFLHPVFYSGRFYELIRISHDVILANSSEAGIVFLDAGSDFLFFLKNIPLAWVTGFFRPFPWEAFSLFSHIAAIEQFLFLLLFLYAIRLAFVVKISQNEIWWIIGVLIYCSVLAVVISISTPNFGTLIRYQVAYMPFIWFLVLWFIGKRLNQRRG